MAKSSTVPTSTVGNSSTVPETSTVPKTSSVAEGNTTTVAETVVRHLDDDVSLCGGYGSPRGAAAGVPDQEKAAQRNQRIRFRAEVPR